MSSFFDLNVAVSALRAQQYAMTVTGNNIANANTDGYHRQEVQLVANTPMTLGASMGSTRTPQIGAGVSIQGVRRYQIDYIDSQYRLENQALGMWSSRNNALNQVEPLFPEPGDSGLSAAMDKFWNSWEDLAASPEGIAPRTSVVQNATTLSDRIRETYGSLRTLQSELDFNVRSSVDEVNNIAKQIATLNTQISKSSSTGSQPNELMDARDKLLEQMSGIIKVESHGGVGSDMIVSIGGKTIVQGNHVNELSVEKGSNGFSQLKWIDDGTAVAVSGGQLKGAIDVRDVDIQAHIDGLNDIAVALVNRVNSIHSTGTDMNGKVAGGFFIPGSDASNIAVLSSLTDDPSGVAASGNGTLGDNAKAVDISKIQTEKLIDGNTKTIGLAYSSIIARIGSGVREAKTQVTSHDLTLTQLDTQRQSVTGVSLDEEMANMLRFQQSYNAAARIVTVIDEMMSTIISGMGVGGR